MPPLTSKARLLAEPGHRRTQALGAFAKQIGELLEPSPIQQAILQAVGQSQVRHLGGQRLISPITAAAFPETRGVAPPRTEAQLERRAQIESLKRKQGGGQVKLLVDELDKLQRVTSTKVNNNRVAIARMGHLFGQPITEQDRRQAEKLRQESTHLEKEFREIQNARFSFIRAFINPPQTPQPAPAAKRDAPPPPANPDEAERKFIESL